MDESQADQPGLHPSKPWALIHHLEEKIKDLEGLLKRSHSFIEAIAKNRPLRPNDVVDAMKLNRDLKTTLEAKEKGNG